MQLQTRAAFNRFLDQQAALNGADPSDVRAGKNFTVTPSVQQKLIDRQQESSAFLQAINIQTVSEQMGETLGLSVSGPLASRTNTAGGTARTTTDPSGLDGDSYVCVQTNSDTHLTYAKLDAWAKFKDFQTRIRNQIIQRQALDRIMIGWNGTTAAAQSNKATNPLLQDVNVGWLQKVRGYKAGASVLAEGGKEDGKIIIDAAGAGDYKNVHALVVDATHNLLPSWARGDSDLVAILGDDLLHETFFPLVDSNLVPSETLAADLVMSAKRVGGKKAATVPFFPSNAILVTRLDNLSIYEQDGKRRRTIVDRAELDRVQTFESSNDAYVIEDFDYACLIENVQFGVTP